jgi:hypothetical protein
MSLAIAEQLRSPRRIFYFWRNFSGQIRKKLVNEQMVFRRCHLEAAWCDIAISWNSYCRVLWNIQDTRMAIQNIN